MSQFVATCGKEQYLKIDAMRFNIRTSDEAFLMRVMTAKPLLQAPLSLEGQLIPSGVFFIILLALFGVGACTEGFAAQSGPTAEDILAMTPAGCPDPMLRKDTPMDVGQKMVMPRKRANRVVLREPGVLDKDNTEYVLERDIHAPGTGFTIMGKGITLNLDGHTIFYNEKEAGFGVHLGAWWQTDVEVINGVIKQGGANGRGNQNGIGCNPLRTLSGKGNRFAGLHVIWSGDDIHGMLIQHHEGLEVVNNTFTDNGTVVTNRHQGLDALSMHGGKDVLVRGNLITRARHRGIRINGGSNLLIEKNEVHIESVATNSFAIFSGSGIIRANKVFGRGVHPIGIWPGDGVKVVGNYVEVQNTAKSTEYENPGCAGLRMTWGQNNGAEVWANTFYVKARRNGVAPGIDSWGRALFVGLPRPGQAALFHHNLIVAANNGDGAKAAAVAMVCENETPDFVLEDNIIASDWSTILLSDDYGWSNGFPVFKRNRIIKINNGSKFHTINAQYKNMPSTATLISNSFEEGASPYDIDFELPSSSLKEIRLGWTVTINVKDASGMPLRSAAVVVKDQQGQIAQQAWTDDKGSARIDLMEKRLTNEVNGQILTDRKLQEFTLAPYTVLVESNGRSKTLSLNSTQDMTMEVQLEK